jgi:hypothetical protein
MKKKRQRIDWQNHHITPRSRGGELGKNLKKVPANYHQAYHLLFLNMTPDEVQRYLHEVWFTYKHFVSPIEWLEAENK